MNVEGMATAVMDKLYGTPPSAEQLKELSHGALWRLDRGDTRANEFTSVGSAMIAAALQMRPGMTSDEFRDLCLMLAAFPFDAEDSSDA